MDQNLPKKDYTDVNLPKILKIRNYLYLIAPLQIPHVNPLVQGLLLHIPYRSKEGGNQWAKHCLTNGSRKPNQCPTHSDLQRCI